MEIQFGIAPFGFDSGPVAVLKNTIQLILEDMGNFDLSSLVAITSYSTARDRPIGDRYVNGDLIAHAFSVFEGVEASQMFSMKALGVDSARRCASTLFSNFLNFEEPGVLVYVSLLDTVEEMQYFCVGESLVLVEEFEFFVAVEFIFFR